MNAIDSIVLVQQWESAYFDDENRMDERMVENWCLDQIPNLKPCTESRIEESVSANQPDQNVKLMDLYYNVIRSVEEEPSRYKLVLDLLNVLSIFFGITAFELLETIRGFVWARWRVGYTTVLVYLICWLGLCFHSNRIIAIVSDELSFAQHYVVANRLQMPEIFLCFHTTNVSLIDANRKLTGNDLEELTSELSAEKIFDSIAYRNELNKWVVMRSNFSTEIFQIETLYFLRRKWWVIPLSHFS